jgi:hypothetical protein
MKFKLVLIGADRNPEILGYVFLYNDLAPFRWGSTFGSDAVLMASCHSAPMSLACRRSSFPRPYTRRLTSFSLVICPSV